MGTVKNPNLSLLVGLAVSSHHHRQARFLKPKLLLQPFRPLNGPKGKNLAGIQQGILIAVFLLQPGYLSGGIAGDNPVHQGGAEDVLLLHPLEKGRLQFPLADVLLYTMLEHFSVVVNQLTGENDKAVALGSHCLKPTIKKLGQLCRKSLGRRILQLTGRIVDNARLGGVADNITQRRIFGTGQNLIIVSVGIEAAADTGNDPFAVYPLSIFKAPQIQGIKPVLFPESFCVVLPAYRLHQHHLGIQAGFLIEDIQKSVSKAPQENSFPELNHLFRCLFQQVALMACFPEGLIRKLFHCALLYLSVTA